MDELFNELTGVICVLLSSKSHKPICIHVHFERVEARNEHVDAQIVLQPIDQVGVGDVSTGKYTLSLVNFRVVSDNLDSSSTASCDRFQDP